MEGEQIRSILSQLGMFLIKKSREDIRSAKEWMSAWETKSSDGISIVVSILLTDNEKEVEMLKLKLNEFAAGAKIEMNELFNMEREEG